MPATIVPSPGTVVEVWITWLDDRELARMNETEGAGTLYSYGILSPVQIDSDVALPGPPHAYVDCAGALELDGVAQAIAAVPASSRRFPALDSEHAMLRVAPLIGWAGSVFALLLDNVRSPSRRAQRTQALEAFKRGEIDFLVATDVAARGLDIVSLPCVINYDVPTHADDYVHRIGRTGRAGQEGRAFTLMLPEGDAHQRLSALRRFAERLTHYKQRRIWPAVTNVRRRAELDCAVRLRIPFVTGPAVCAPLSTPAGGRAVALANLPLTLREEGVPRPQVA